MLKRSNVSPLHPRTSAWIIRFCVPMVAAILAGCNAGGPISVVSSYGPGITFSGLGPAYAWAPNPPEQRFGAPEMHELIHQSVEKHLAAKGFAPKSGEAVDFWIEYRVARREKTYAGAVAHGETIEEGSLVLEVLNPATRRFIWRGIARARIFDSDTPAVRKQRMEAAMRGLMERFPAKS